MGTVRVGVGLETILRLGSLGGVAVATAGADSRFGVVVAGTGFVPGRGIAVARTTPALRFGEVAPAGGTGFMLAVGKGLGCAPIFPDGVGVTRV